VPTVPTLPSRRPFHSPTLHRRVVMTWNILFMGSIVELGPQNLGDETEREAFARESCPR
jgi:hypothetical protein